MLPLTTGVPLRDAKDDPRGAATRKRINISASASAWPSVALLHARSFAVPPLNLRLLPPLIHHLFSVHRLSLSSTVACSPCSLPPSSLLHVSASAPSTTALLTTLAFARD